MPHVYLPQILWHSKDNKRSDRIYSVDIQPHPNYYSVKKLNRKYELFKKYIKDKENKCDTHFLVQSEVQGGNNSPLSSVHPNGMQKNGEVIIGEVSSANHPVNLRSDENGADDNEQNSEIKKNNCCDTRSCNWNSSSQEKSTPATLKGEEEHVDSDSQDGEEKKTKKGKKKSIKFNIATCGADEFVHLWRIYIKDDLIVKCLSRFIGHNGEINCVRFNKNGRYLASGGEDKFLYIWEKSKKPKNIPLGYDISFLDYKEWWNIVGSFRCSGVINSITWSNNDTLYIGNEDNNINIIEFVKNSNCKVKVLEGHAGIIQGISLDVNNEFLASLSADQTLKIWKKKNDGKSWKLENSIKNIKADQLEKRSTAYITYNEYEFNEKGADKNDHSATKKDEKKEMQSTPDDLTEELAKERKGDAGEGQTEKEKIWQKGSIETQETSAENEDHEEDYYDEEKKKMCSRKEEKELRENEPEDEEEVGSAEEEEEKKLRRCLFASEEMLPSFFRRIDFSPNGEFLIAPSGIQFEQIEKLHDRNTKPDENVKTVNQIKAFSCFYIYHKNLFIRYNIPFFTVFSQTSHFLVAKFNYNTYNLRTHQNILKRCYKHLMSSQSNDPDGSDSANKKRKMFDESGFINELKNYEHLIKLNYEKTLLFNDTQVQDDVSEDVSSTISDSDVQYDDEKEDFIDSTGDYSLSHNLDKNEEEQEKEECEDLAAEAEDPEEDTEEEEAADENEDNEDKEDDEGDNEEDGENDQNDQTGQNDCNEGGASPEQKQDAADKCSDEKNELEVCETKEKKEERFIYSLGTFDGSVYFYDSEILDTPISIVKNIHLCPITDISWNNLGNICACSSSDGYVSFYYFDHNELGKVKSYNNYYFEKKCNDLTFDEHYFESTFYDEVDFFNKDQLNDYTSSEDECEESNLSVNKEETKVRRINLVVGNAANFVLEQNTRK
ncbi:Chromatin assembly factor 1 subunit B [Plasmodium coatneyi]|uniref:Protein HIRA n=1 Tax=Plasmodium coatneyi TaxID=208452 RepID=A0A1B1E0S8_9APIC|nr:Chromatin assembly factor 1 subunit B [Plasmodium coatneyi]ANQ08628.1 Chromatin assembly factor 1 subunit B [Plasmodium coatneyi]